jgi:RNA polymerase sigma-70 factor (ECF subfamily)
MVCERECYRKVMLQLTGQASKMEFWEIYDEHYSRVKKVVVALVRDEWVADDLTQETFVRVQDHLADLRDPAKISSWIFRIAYNLCQDHFRKKGQFIDNDGSAYEESEISEGSSSEKQFEQHQMGECVRQEIDRLPESFRSVLILSDLREFSHQEIADLLGITVENAKVRLHRARKMLKALLQQKCTFEIDERNVLVCDPKDKPC